MILFKMKSVTALFMFLVFLLTAPVSAEAAVRPGNFIHSHEIQIILEGAIHNFTLPRFVYEGLIQSQRLDLAVFNSNAEIVPFTVREAAPVYQVIELPEVLVPFYELPPDSRDGRPENFTGIGPVDIYVQTGAGGQVISVTGGGRREGLRERRYLLDFSSIAENSAAVSHELRLVLPDVRISARVSAFESLNLRDWRPLLTDAPLIQLQGEDSRLVSDRVELPRAPQRYVLLRIMDVDPSFELNGAGYSVTVQSRYFMEENADIGGTAVPNSGNPVFEYDLLGAFPILSVNFLLQEPGFHWVSFFSRPTVNAEWQARGRMSLSKITSQVTLNESESVTLNEPTTVNLREDRFWRVEFEGAFSGAPPVMRISWRPAEVYFLAQGGGPYALLFGSSQREANITLQLLALQNDSFMRITDTPASFAEVGPPIDPAENPSLAPGDGFIAEAPIEENEWQRYLVWGLLAMGGLMLSVMAFKLLKKN